MTIPPGARKIAHVLSRDSGIVLAPGTVNSILCRNGCIDPEASRAATPWQCFGIRFPTTYHAPSAASRASAARIRACQSAGV